MGAPDPHQHDQRNVERAIGTIEQNRAQQVENRAQQREQQIAQRRAQSFTAPIEAWRFKLGGFIAVFCMFVLL